MKLRANYPLVAVLLGLVSCSGPEDRSPVNISVIGDPGIVLRQATRQGLVGFDSGGAIEPALAERWIVTEDGLSYVFRIREANWSDGKPLAADQVAQALKRAINDTSGATRPLVGNIASIVPMTGRVIEIRLKRPQQIFLQILAQLELGIANGNAGTGPFFLHSRREQVTRLRPVRPPGIAALSEEDDTPPDANDLRIRASNAPVAVTRFLQRRTDVVLGGSLADLPVAQAANLGEERLRIEPVRGLFGLYVARTDGPLKDKALRQALSLSVERSLLSARLSVNDWPVMRKAVPFQLQTNPIGGDAGTSEPAVDERLQSARALVGGSKHDLSISLPEGPGMRIFFAALATDWSRIGITLKRVSQNQPADLRLLDAVATVNSPAWYLSRLGCRHMPACDKGSDALLARALNEADGDKRLLLMAQAESAMNATHAYIPLARPIRWSLVSADLPGWKASPIAHHPLNRLRPFVR